MRVQYKHYITTGAVYIYNYEKPKIHIAIKYASTFSIQTITEHAYRKL